MMEKESSAKPSRTNLRFSLMTIFMVMSCVCCYLAGESMGFRKKLQGTSSSESPIRIYKFKEISSSNLTGIEKDTFLSTITTKIKSEVMPSVWKDATRRFGIGADCGTGSLIVVADPNVHGAVALFLENFDTSTLLEDR